MKEFLSKKEIYQIKILSILIGCIVFIFVISVVCDYFWKNYSNTYRQIIPLTSLKNITSQELTRKIIDRVFSSAPLSPDERTIINKQFGGVGSRVWSSLSAQERKAVVEALNK